MGKYVSNKPVVSDGAAPAARYAIDSLAAAHPALWEYLTVDVFEDGTERQTSTLLLFAERGLIKGCLKDRSVNRALWASAATVTGLLEVLEEALSTESGDWRAERPLGAGKAKK